MGIYDYNETRNKLEGLEFEDNLKLARKYMVESVYRSANIEGIGVTFPETQAFKKMYYKIKNKGLIILYSL